MFLKKWSNDFQLSITFRFGVEAKLHSMINRHTISMQGLEDTVLIHVQCTRLVVEDRCQENPCGILWLSHEMMTNDFRNGYHHFRSHKGGRRVVEQMNFHLSLGTNIETQNLKPKLSNFQQSLVPKHFIPQVEISGHMGALQLVCPCLDILLKGLHKLHSTAR